MEYVESGTPSKVDSLVKLIKTFECTSEIEERILCHRELTLKQDPVK